MKKTFLLLFNLLLIGFVTTSCSSKSSSSDDDSDDRKSRKHRTEFVDDDDDYDNDYDYDSRARSRKNKSNRSNRNRNTDLYAEIASAVEESSNYCPVNYGNGVTLTDVSFDGDKVVYYYTVAGSLNNGVDTNILKEAMLGVVEDEINSDYGALNFYNNVIEAGIPLVYKYRDYGGETFTVKITPRELSRAING